jgi:hypothetical protein
MLVIVGIGVILAAIASLLEGVFGKNETRYTGPVCPPGQCTPDRNNVLTDHYGAETYTDAGRRSGRVRHVEEQPEFEPFTKTRPAEWVTASQKGWKEHQLAEKVDKIVAGKTEQLKEQAKTDFYGRRK